MKDMKFAREVVEKEIERLNKCVVKYKNEGILKDDVDVAKFKLRSMLTMSEFMEDIDYPHPDEFDFHESDESLEVLETYELLCNPVLEDLDNALDEKDVSRDKIASAIHDYWIMLLSS
ncbi:TPA: hypothetical protein NJZ47_005118 [Vibrio parahaemolyticus]|nr:hypothetical protein [Vibrio parahaemolyticus]HCG5287104.1 hypothetical protein [Vibrio parahaemolyticus]